MSSTTADDLIDRRRLRRKLTFWRIVTLAVVVVGLFAVTVASMPEEGLGAKSRPHIAKVRIEGTILEDEDLLDMLEEVETSEAVKGVIVAIDSPGGTTAGGEAIYEAIRRIAEEKPITSQVGTLAASAGYMIASATDHVVARQTSIVGSIGVLVQYPNFSELLDNLGIDVRSIKSSPLKAEPGMFDDPPEGAEDMLRSMILDSYSWFKDLVQERRGLSDAEIGRLADGSVFTGRQALDRKLVDALGGEDTARAWLTEQGVDEDLKIVEWKKPEPGAPLAWASAMARQLGLDAGGGYAITEFQGRLFLDGLVSVWHVDR